MVLRLILLSYDPTSAAEIDNMVQPIRPEAVERKIYFYRLRMEPDEQGVPAVLDPQPALAHIGQLIAGEDWYQDAGDGNVFCLLPEGQAEGNSTARFCIVRRTGLPQLEAAGQIVDLNIADEQGLLEAIHVVFFENNIIGADYNHFGPRVSRLPFYMEEKANDQIPNRVRVTNLVRGDPAAVLDTLAGLHLLDLSVIPSHVQVVRQHDQGLGGALAASAEITAEPEVVSLNIKPSRNTEPGFLQDFAGALRAMVRNEEFRAGAKRLKIEGRRQGHRKIETFDLLKDDITMSVQMIRLNPRGRALDPNHAYAQIVAAYNELHDDIQEAVGVMDVDQGDNY